MLKSKIATYLTRTLPRALVLETKLPLLIPSQVQPGTERMELETSAKISVEVLLDITSCKAG